ncbi:non-ribosomal peptide synthetase [Sphingomonas desiccabilis]|uniref:Amino acid adenylation domain-containing protein n=1 Tax=Sphingomonas desiccabilis TaxID=429134 RepID=A0A4Q2IPH6_9SPHN|nr:non-ribosomal peptide synthetase [Sphingomonas desiccabilis]MBB3911823.1 amino acid adenylation domain-containing protein [Sphingomonas desiccabilis]RXZ31462.1 amino acid adenylation domain-containing protein [Sphingomonas desiccabilis]
MLQHPRPYPEPCFGVHDQVLAAALAYPRSIAIREDGGEISYRQLERRATALARRLMYAGIPPGSVVAVRMRRSTDQVIALLGVLLAGCAFLVIDPDDPEERRAFMIADSGAAGVVAREADGEVAPGEIRLDDEEFGRGINLPARGGADLAYVVYTSGTTGVPNGVEITHDNLLNFMQWTIRAFAVTSQDRAGYAMGLTFDAAQSEIWPYLASGASIEIVDPMTRTSAELLQRWLIERAITIGTIPMALAEQLLSASWPQGIPLRLMLTGGDVLRAFPRASLPFEFVNNYGPSECTIAVTSGRVPVRGEMTDADGPDLLPTIGAPIDGADIHLLDDDMQPVPDGAEGEIWIGGRCVGRGYRHRPQLTAAKFLPDPFSIRPNARLYRTGDRARRLASGEFAFCGRTDSQTKIRGVRIELDEVAVCLQRHPSVGAAVVTVREHAVSGRQLIAYVAPVPGRGEGDAGLASLPSAEEMRNFVERHLPRSHAPAHFVPLAALPMTRNGKVDLEALPAPEPIAPAGRRPQTETEMAVAEIVCDILELDDVSADDDFFLIGGHSLLATQVVIQSREAFGVELTLRDLFETPTIEGLAAEIDARLAQGRGFVPAMEAPPQQGLELR